METRDAQPCIHELLCTRFSLALTILWVRFGLGVIGVDFEGMVAAGTNLFLFVTLTEGFWASFSRLGVSLPILHLPLSIEELDITSS